MSEEEAFGKERETGGEQNDRVLVLIGESAISRRSSIALQ
jgi:hypothetical protein